MTINKVSQVSREQLPQFIDDGFPLFGKFIEYYYKSQEKTGLGQNILNNFLNYMDIDKLNVDILDGATTIVEDITTSSSTIVVENIDSFLENNGSVLVGDEVIFYERAVASPSIALSPGISFEEVQLKEITLAQIADLFDGSRQIFPLTTQNNPVSAPSPQHLQVTLYGELLVPLDDYNVDGTNITFVNPPRARTASDDISTIQIKYFNGFVESEIVRLDNISGGFNDETVSFPVTKDSIDYKPEIDEYILATYDGSRLIAKNDFTFDGNLITFNFTPLPGRKLTLYSIEAPIPSFGSGAIGFSRVNNNGELVSVAVGENGSNYRFEYPPKVSIKDNNGQGSGGSAVALINGVKSVSLLDGGFGYSDTNPPTVFVEAPTTVDSKLPKIKASVTNGSISSLEIEESGSGYTFTPRLSFVQPGGAKLATPTIISGSISGDIAITDGGSGYTTSPTVYVDFPTGEDSIRASLRANLVDGKVSSITVLNPGQGYETAPRVAIVDPVGAQVLETRVDADGRVISIELLDGGSGYEDVPSVYIVDDRQDPVTGNYSGGTGATAVCAIFNGQITDINITNFGTGYSADAPPSIVIQAPPKAEASVVVGLSEITGFEVINSGSNYSKCKLEGCARAVSGMVNYNQVGNAEFSNDTTAVAHQSGEVVKCLDALFIKRLLDKYIEQYLPDVPELDYKNIDVRSAIKNIKTFYSTKGTSFSIAYLFKLLYGENVSISYPKDQLIKPSASTWATNTILRAKLVSGNPQNIKDATLIQEADIADPNVQDASALVENFISIKTSEFDIYELILSQETIEGNFTVPYKSRLAEELVEGDLIITVDSTIGWPERNGELIINDTEIVRYKEKSLNQFIECTRDTNSSGETTWDAATEIRSIFRVYLNKGTLTEVVMDIVGIVDAQQTTLSDTGSYYLPGDKLTVSKLGGSSVDPQLTTWLYNVKKLIEVETITYGGINNSFATVTCSAPHGLLVGDQVTVYGANPIIYNGTFLVTSRDSTTIFQYNLPQPAVVEPQGNILISVDLNKGKSENDAIRKTIAPYTTNIQNTFFNAEHVYVASTGIPNYNIGPFLGSALLPGNQRKLNRFPLNVQTISTKSEITPGSIGTWVNGVSVWSYKSPQTKTFGAVTGVSILNSGSNYDAANPPTITIAGGGGSGASSTVVVDGSITAIEVDQGGSGYTSSPLVSIVGGNGSGASATAIITRGVVSRILVNNGGSGYTSQPEITIVGGDGSGAAATAQVRGPVESVNIIDGGASYTSNPTVTLSSGFGAVAQPIVNNGRILSIAIISGGQGYTTAPEVEIFGSGFGAVAKAIIDTDGDNAGKVTGVEILNRGIGYVDGTTTISLSSIGSGGEFSANVFQWTYNLQETTTFDSAKGSVFEGLNNQYGGEYSHVANPQRLRYILGDNLILDSNSNLTEQNASLDHSPIIGWAFDGNPIYGPYGFDDPTDQTSNIVRMGTSYRLKIRLVYDDITNPYPSRDDGPSLIDEPAGTFIEDYEYDFGSGDLDQYNGRFCKTPEFPNGRYCYFVTIDNSEAGNSVFPYVLGPSFNSIVDIWNLNDYSIQQNIPTGVVRYRDPYENVDIDVERIPNSSSNALTTEAGDTLLFEIEDENKDGVISQDETDDPDQIFEESPLQLYDYFPKVRFDSRVDIEVDTITRFENASVTGFIVENAGQSYQVNDIIVFDNATSGGSGASARISKISGESITSYSYENVANINYGILTTVVPHNLVVGDKITVNYTPVMDTTNKRFVVRQYKGIEEVVINQTGSGYSVDIPPTIIIDGDGVSAEVEAIVETNGSINSFNIINSGSQFTENPRFILSHPQIFKKANYATTLLNSNEDVKINDIYIAENKKYYVCGRSVDSVGNYIGFVAKISESGLLEWRKTTEVTAPSGELTYLEFTNILVEGSDIYAVGINKPNVSVLDAYNPDIVFVKFQEDSTGLNASVSQQRAYAGISGSTRSDTVTGIKKLTDNRYVICGHTNTNSSNPLDAFVIVIDNTGTFVTKRKIASDLKSEKIVDFIIKNEQIYFLMETAATNVATDISLTLGKCRLDGNVILVDWMKEFTNPTYSFLNSTIELDEFEDFYLTSTLCLKATPTVKNAFWVAKINDTPSVIWSYSYAVAGGNIDTVNRGSVDIFGDINIAYTKTHTNDEISLEAVQVNYKGEIVGHTSNRLTPNGDVYNNIEGIKSYATANDVSGDLTVYGQSQWNRNEFTFTFDQTDSATDTCGKYTPTLIGNDSTDALTLVGDGVAKLFGYDVATPANWENAAIQFAAANLDEKLGDSWTLEFTLYKDSTNSQTHSQTQQTLVAIGDATDTTGGLWLYYDVSSGQLELVISNSVTALNAAGSGLNSVSSNLYADDTWQWVALQKNGDAFSAYINGTQVFTGTVLNTAFENKDLYIGNIPGKNGTTGQFASTYQGQYYIGDLRLKNRALTPTVPSDITTAPTDDQFELAYNWSDDAWFTAFHEKYDYIDYKGISLRLDKTQSPDYLGSLTTTTNTELKWNRSLVAAATGVNLPVALVNYAIGSEGLQALDFNSTTLVALYDNEAFTHNQDILFFRTATIPSPGSQKVIASAVIKDRYYFKVTDTLKIDNIKRLTINQPFNLSENAKLVLDNGSGGFVNSGYITAVDVENRYVYVAINNNTWGNDTNTGFLTTSRFDEQDTYGIVGPNVNDTNTITNYEFVDVVNTTPGTFDIDMQDYDMLPTVGGTDNLDEYARFFSTFSLNDYSVKIIETSGATTFVPGSVVGIEESDVSYNSERNTIQITGLTGVTKITLVADLEKILQVTAVTNSDEVYIVTESSHYLSPGENIFVDGNPEAQYNGSFTVDRVISVKEYTYKLNAIATEEPALTSGDVDVFSKSPTLKMYNQHQYIFDMSHVSLIGGNLSFAKDSLYKLEYSFNIIERIGTPGIVAGAQVPSIKLKVDDSIVTNISYYFDPSRTGDNSPIDSDSYLDIGPSPYIGNFTITETTGGTITTGDNTMKFVLVSEPEDVATIEKAKYATSSTKAVGSISDIRIVNGGGFYTKVPIISNIESSRKIERVEIVEPGTEYAVGLYNSVPISGDGEGGLVSITVENTTDSEGVSIPGQITKVTVTSPGKNYTTATIDVDSISGILGVGLTGSGAELNVIIPPAGTGASIFATGRNIGKIKQLKNNNFGYDYPHDYTLRPEISFPLNAQLINTSILESIRVSDPGSGYSQAPAVVITGGGGSGAIAESTIQNGRLSQIIVKDPGSGYSSPPTVELKSSFNYVVNLDLGLLQFAFPHGIINGAQVTLEAVDIGDGVEFPLAAGAIGRLNSQTTYYAISGAEQSLEADQLKLAITESNAELGDAIGYVNAGIGRQQVLTSSFGGAAVANVVTSTFLEGEQVYQGDSIQNATATGFVSENNGWQIGPRILKIVNYNNNFSVGEKVTGVISKSAGVISDLNIASGVLEIGPITKTTGQFIDDVGKPSEIIQKIQDSYYYQDFSYAVKSSVSINDWKNILIKNVHPASFKVFGELNITENAVIPNKEIDFQLTKSVELARNAIVPNIQNFALAEPIYQDFNNTEVLFRQKRLTSSENILTSVVQRLDDISNLFDGIRTQFPLTIDQNNIVADAKQLMIVLNGVVQTPETAFKVLSDSIVFSEPPSPPASIKYASVTIEQISIVQFEFSNQSGTPPDDNQIGAVIVGTQSGARAQLTKVLGTNNVGNLELEGFIAEGVFIANELCTINATGYAANLQSTSVPTQGSLFFYGEEIRNLDGDEAVIERVNLQTGQETPIAELRYAIGLSTTVFEVIPSTGIAAPVLDVFELNENYQIGSEIVTVTGITQNVDSTTLEVSREQNGTALSAQQAGVPIYGTQIEITNQLVISKTTGTYQSTPGLFDIQLNDVIIASQSGVVARVIGTSAYQDPSTQQFISQINISDGSSFFGLLFNRITSPEFPNIVIDDISQSQVNVVEYGDNISLFSSSFPANEFINNYSIIYDNAVGTFQDNEFIRNWKFDYGNSSDDFAANEEVNVRKLTFKDAVGDGFFTAGQILRSPNSKAEVIGYNQARSIIYLSKMARTQSTGEDYHNMTFVAGAEINTYNEKFGNACLALSKGTSAHTFVSATENGITAGGGATGTFTAATGTTYDAITGDMIIEIGTHTLTTSNTVTIVASGVTFTCASDNNTAEYSYPRATDPQFGQAIAISAVTSTTITVNVGAVPVDEYLTIPTSTEFGFGTGDFTLELWMKTNSIASGGKTLLDFRSATAEVAPYLYLDGANLKYYVNAAEVITGTTNFAVNNWYHIAISRSSGTTKLFLNGVQEGSDYADTNDYGSTKPIRIGAAWNATNVLPGYIDELRVSTNARYTADFGNPTGIFQGDANTVLLIHFDGAQGQTYTDDWSGEANWTRSDFFNNDAILATKRSTNGSNSQHSNNTQRYYDAASLIENNRDFIGAETQALIQVSLPYTLDTSVVTNTITASDYLSMGSNTYYGKSVGITQDKIVVGSYEADIQGVGNNRGAVYTYNLDGTGEVKIATPTGGGGDDFGWDVDAFYSTADSTSKLVVGAPFYEPSSSYSNSGIAYIYNADGTNQVILNADVITSNNRFGYSCAAGGGKVAVGAYGDDTYRGSVFIFDEDGTNRIKVTASDSATYDYFGFSIAIANNKLIVGAYGHEDTGSGRGCVYVYDLDGTNEVKIQASDAENGDAFGFSVAGDGDKILVGAYSEDTGASGAGSAYLYNYDGTGEIKFQSNDVQSGDQFGHGTLLVDGEFIIVGNVSYDGISSNGGALEKFIYDSDAGTVTYDSTLPLPSHTSSFHGEFRGGNIAYDTTARKMVYGNRYQTVTGLTRAGQVFVFDYNQSSTASGFDTPIKETLTALVDDLRGGSNSHIWDNAATYVNRSSLPITSLLKFIGQEASLISGYTSLKTIIQNVINNYPLTVTGSHGIIQFTDVSITDSSYPTLTKLTPTNVDYNATTGDMVITVVGHTLTTADVISIAEESLKFTCSSDGNVRVLSHPRVSDTRAFNAALRITATTTDTFTINVGASPADQQYTHQFSSADADAITVLDYTTGDCADVTTTNDNLIDIVIDTLNEGSGTTTNTADGDHLATVTKLSPAYEFLGGTVDGFYEIPLTVSNSLPNDQVFYTNRIGKESRNRYIDAANLIRLNSSVIVDKASFDLLARYPDLANDMPRNDPNNTDDPNAGTRRCQTDLALLLASLADDIENGGSKNTVTVSNFYLGVNDALNHIRLQVWQSLFAHDRLGFYMKQAINGNLVSDVGTDDIIVGDWGITDDAIVNFTPTAATYDAATGVMVITIGSHSLALGRRITIADNSLTFTCTSDGNVSNETYPRTTDPASGVSLEVTASTATTITVNVGASPAGQQYAHTFVSAAANAVSTAGECANVETAIDTLIDTLNDAIAPVSANNNYRIAADRLYFNRLFIQEEVLGSIIDEFTYSVGGTTYNSYDFSGDNNQEQLKDDINLFILSAISDLQTGGSNSSIDAISTFLDSRLEVTRIEDILTVFISILKEVKTLGIKALRNQLYSLNEGTQTSPNYQGQFTSQSTYRDSESISATDLNDFSFRFRDLIEIVIKTIAPSDIIGMGDAAKQILFNEHYYESEISSIVNTQFGSNTWQYTDFLNGILKDVLHDAIITNTTSSNSQTARRISLLREGVVSEIVFTAGTGYRSAPTITLDPPGTGITATAEVVLDTSGSLSSLSITTPGSGYTFSPDLVFTGSTFDVGDSHGGSSTLTNGAVTAVTYDGIVYDFNNSVTSALTLGSAVSMTAGTSGMLTGRQLLLFGTGSGSRFASIQTPFDTTYAETIRVYVIAGGSSNGGNAPEINEDLKLYYSTTGSNWVLIDTLVEGGSTGTSKEYTNFNTLNYVDITLPTLARAQTIYFRFQQDQYTDGSFDQYGVTRIGLIDGAQQFSIDTTIAVNNASLESGTPSTAEVELVTGIGIAAINITNPGSGYDPANPPTATLTGGGTTNPGTITDLSVSLDNSRFIVNAEITNGSGTTGNVLEDSGNNLYIGSITGSGFADGDTLTQGLVTAEIPSNGVGPEINYYNDIANVETINTARNISSLVEGEIISANLLTNPEFATTSTWRRSRSNLINAAALAPDATQTAIAWRSNTTSSTSHYVYRDYYLTAYETLDNGSIRFDTSNTTFDEGAPSDGSKRQFTYSFFAKSVDYDELYVRIQAYNSSTSQRINFSRVNIETGVVSGISSQGQAFDIEEYGSVPYGNGWFRFYFTFSVSYGYSLVRFFQYLRAPGGGGTGFSADLNDEAYMWGMKLNEGGLDTYSSESSQIFYSNTEYNVKKFAIETLEDLTVSALNGVLASPSGNSGFTSFYDSDYASSYQTDTIARFIRQNLNIILNQLLNGNYYATVTTNNGITIPTYTYGTRDLLVPLSGAIEDSDYIYGKTSDSYAEVSNTTLNEAKIVKVFKRFRIEGDITDGPFNVNETIQKQGDATVTGIVYSIHSDANYDYLDVEITGQPWTILDTMVGDENGTTAQIGNIQDRIQVIDLQGDFAEDIQFEGYTSNSVATPDEFVKIEAAVLTNTDGKLVVDTDSLTGLFEVNSVIYPSTSRLYIDVIKYGGSFEVNVGDRITSLGHIVLGITIQNNRNIFTKGGILYKIVNGLRDPSQRAIITDVDLENNFLYAVVIEGTFGNGVTVAQYTDINQLPIGEALVSTTVENSGAASAIVQSIQTFGLNRRLYLSGIIGTFSSRDSIKSVNGYRSAITNLVELKGRVKRAFRGFDGSQTTFDLTISNGIQYLPDTEGHLLTFINGILQPPGEGFTTFADKIQFTEPPSQGSAFTGYYVGKLRKLDDISFDFDSLRQSFNLRRNGVFYSLTLTEGVQSTNIRPENNIIVSLNGVIQEPGVGFEIVGSRIIFSEIPRVGSTFVAFSYVGSEADVDAAEVVPPIEAGDFIDIQGETSDREVAVIESSNSLITFDYLGSIFGKDAQGQVILNTGYISDVRVTSAGSGYTSRPVIRVDSISGFDGNIKPLVGVGGVIISNSGSNYETPAIEVETSVPDDWVAPDLSQYGVEVINPELD
ncbi:structural protein [Synechococcus phage S-MbCM6]|uniref:Structural protein n=1 Tax=Synechococcus phage ACG-2014c TaxID=1079998 RepID=A0A0E3EL74_9CAUD|nr:structural protein [Synechococcus phage ACG-2014c]